MQQHKKSSIESFAFYSISILHCFLLFSCAQIITPTGGPRDTQAPEITQAQPTNFSTNFQQKDIHIQFNEWIQPLTNAKNQVIISPEIEPFPSITIARNDLSIRFKNALEPNTTYSIFFGDNIKDNNEGNPYPNFKYVFSTGNFLDSLIIKGHITTNLDKIPDNTFLYCIKIFLTQPLPPKDHILSQK
ncbi:MAG: Ig-like domain-containing protein [Chitinophagales bacterium]